MFLQPPAALPAPRFGPGPLLHILAACLLLATSCARGGASKDDPGKLQSGEEALAVDDDGSAGRDSFDAGVSAAALNSSQPTATDTAPTDSEGTLAPGDAEDLLAPGTGAGPETPPGTAPTAAPSDEPGDSGSEQTPAPASTGSGPHPNCKAGTYRGTFEGRIGVFGLGLFPIDGELEVHATSDTSGEVLVATDSFIDGTDQDGNPIFAVLEGAMDCRSLTFIGGRLIDGVYVRQAFSMTVNFEGVLDGTYIPDDVPSVSGVWETTGGIEEGSGTFQGSYVGP